MVFLIIGGIPHQNHPRPKPAWYALRAFLLPILRQGKRPRHLVTQKTGT